MMFYVIVLFNVITSILSNVFFNVFVFICGIVLTGSWFTRNNLSYIPSSLEKHSPNVYKLHYYFRGNKYTMFLKIKRGPRKILKVFNEDNEECFEEMESILGPNGDFHQHTIFPVHKQFSGYTFYDAMDKSIVV